jgi:cardiolipin synthase
MTGDHIKSITIDGERAFVGGMNIGREYRHAWHDMMMEITGPVVREVQRDADKAWSKAGLLGDLGLLVHSPAPRVSSRSDQGYPTRTIHRSTRRSWRPSGRRGATFTMSWHGRGHVVSTYVS